MLNRNLPRALYRLMPLAIAGSLCVLPAFGAVTSSGATTGNAVSFQAKARCFGEVVSVANVASMIDKVVAAADDVQWLQADGQLAKDLTQLAANYETAIDFLLEFQKQGGTELTHERCNFAAYSCTRDTGAPTHSNSKRQCSRCAPIQSVPATNPPTCTTSCTLCCTNFGGTDPYLDCLCDANDVC